MKVQSAISMAIFIFVAFALPVNAHARNQSDGGNDFSEASDPFIEFEFSDSNRGYCSPPRHGGETGCNADSGSGPECLDGYYPDGRCCSQFGVEETVCNRCTDYNGIEYVSCETDYSLFY